MKKIYCSSFVRLNAFWNILLRSTVVLQLYHYAKEFSLSTHAVKKFLLMKINLTYFVKKQNSKN